MPGDRTQQWEIILREGVGNVERAMLAHPPKKWLIDIDLEPAHWNGAKVGPRNHSLTLAESENYVVNPTNPGRALDDGV